MLQVPSELQKNFDNLLNRKAVPVRYRPYYKKWLRYYWDFCHKYHHPVSEERSLPFFVGKLREKHQKDFQIKQASHAVSVYYELIRIRQSSGIRQSGAF